MTPTSPTSSHAMLAEQTAAIPSAQPTTHRVTRSRSDDRRRVGRYHYILRILNAMR